MKNLSIALAAVLLVALTGTLVTAWQGARDQGPPPAPPTDVGGVSGVLYARPFQLEEGYANAYRFERPLVTAGWLLVLEVDRDRVVPRELLEPVLYVGDETAEHINRGWSSGRLVVFAPTLEAPQGGPLLALEDLRAWFGPPELPERIDAARLATEIERARVEGVVAMPAAKLQAARERGGALLQLQDRALLERVAAELVLQYAPGEEELANSLLIPLSR